MVRFHPSELAVVFHFRAHRPTGRHRLRTPRIRVQFPVGPLGQAFQPAVFAVTASRRVRLESLTYFARSRGPAAKTPGLHPGNHGSSPCGITVLVLVEQPGVLATLSRWRSRVQIPSGTLFYRHGTRIGIAAKLKPSCLRVRLPLVPFGSCSPRRSVKPLSLKKRGGRREVQFLHDPFLARSSIGSGHQPLTLARRVRFPHGSLNGFFGQVVKLVDTRRSDRRADRHGGSNPSLVTF